MTEPTVRLYGPPLAPFVEKVALALVLKKLPYELVEPSGPDDYRRWNPETGLLPVADIDGQRVADSVRILDVLDERYPEPPLVSNDPRVAASQRALESWAGETFFFYWENYLRDRVGGDDSPGPLARLGILRKGRDPGARAASLAEEFARRIDDLDGFLGTRPYFYAERISRADLAIAAFLRTLLRNEIPGTAPLLANHPRLSAHLHRTQQQTT